MILSNILVCDILINMTTLTLYLVLHQQLLLHHEDQIAPDPQDPIHELLEDLREVPSVDELLGKTYCSVCQKTVIHVL